MMATIEEIKTIIKDSGITVDIDNIDEAMIFSEAGIDSLDIFNILLGIEEKYEITIKNEDTEKLNSISAIIQYLDNL